MKNNAIILVLFALSSCGLNNTPVIESFSIEKDTVAVSENVKMEVVANDQDGDKVRYYWFFNNVREDSFDLKKDVQWEAPDSACTVKVKIVVDDGKAETAQTKQLVVHLP